MARAKVTKRFNAREECIQQASAKVGVVLSKDEQEKFLKVVNETAAEVVAEGNADAFHQRLIQRVGEKILWKKVYAKIGKRNAAIQILKRKALDDAMEGYKAAGLSPFEAIQTMWTGTQKVVPGARQSVAVGTAAYQGRFIMNHFAKVEAERPHIVARLDDIEFDNNLAREMHEIREGGKPGITKDGDAKYLAKVVHEMFEDSRTAYNKLGGAMNKMDGYSGAQVHDEKLMIKKGREGWIDFVVQRLDMRKTFPDGLDGVEAREVLDSLFTTITTGRSSSAGLPGNNKSLDRMKEFSRVLHFKDADAALDYRNEYGSGSVMQNIFQHQKRMSDMVAVMERFGPDPYKMMRDLVADETLKIRNDPEWKKNPAKANKEVAKMQGSAQGGISRRLQSQLDVGMGTYIKVEGATLAAWGSNTRAILSMAFLGKAALLAVPTDTAMAAHAAMMRGDGGMLGGATRHVKEMLTPQRNKKELQYLLGVGFDTWLNNVNPMADGEAPSGMMHKIQAFYFKWNGLSGATDRARKINAMLISAQLGYNSGKSFSKLDPRLRDTLTMSGVTDAEWEAMRSVQMKTVDGKPYLVPESMQDVDEKVLLSLPGVKEKLRTVVKAMEYEKSENLKKGSKDGQTIKADTSASRRKRILDKARFELEMKMRRYMADETSQSIIVSDNTTRKWTMPRVEGRGTWVHEALASVMQFKAFPIAFIQRPLMRAWRGNNRYKDTARLAVGMFAAGYMADTLYDLANNKTPKDPTNHKTWINAIKKSGFLGLYGDLLLGEAYKHYGGTLASLIGPTASTTASLIDLAIKSVNGDATMHNWVTFTYKNTPFMNLAYVKPLMDYYVMNEFKEWMTPGTNQRRRTRIKNEFGQEELVQ